MSGLAFGQTTVPVCTAISPDAAKRQFDVASVKPGGPIVLPYSGNPFALAGGLGSNDPGRVTAAHITLSTLILRAYSLDSDELKGPPWLSSAENGGYAISATMPPSTRPDEFCGMLRNLIAGRFHLTFHYEKQPRPGYELTVMPGGPKFHEFVPGPTPSGEASGSSSVADRLAEIRARGLDANGFPNLLPSQPTAWATQNSATGATKESFRNNIPAFARNLAGIIDQENRAPAGSPRTRVIDKTGLAGVYDIRFEYAGIPFLLGAPGNAPAPAVSDPVDAGPNIFSAVQKQLGLKLTKVGDVQVNVMIVDHIDQKPTEN